MEKIVWVIMSKDRKFIAKGTPRNRHLIRVDDLKDQKRYITYSTEGRARAGYKTSGFYGANNLDNFDYNEPLSKYLEAVKCKMTFDFEK